MRDTTDRRIVKTKFSIRESLLEIMKQKNCNEITVSELCRSANIGRGTFYLHYNDVYEVVQEIEEEILEFFRNTAFLYFEDENTENFRAMLRACLEWILQNENLSLVFLFSPKAEFADRFTNYAIELFYYHSLKYHPKKTSAENRYSTIKVFSGYWGAIKSWLEDGHSISLDTLLDFLI